MYDGIAIGAAAGSKSIVYSISCSGGSPGSVSENTSMNSLTTCGYWISPPSASPSQILAIIGIIRLGIPLSPSNFGTSPSGFLNSTHFL